MKGKVLNLSNKVQYLLFSFYFTVRDGLTCLHYELGLSRVSFKATTRIRLLSMSNVFTKNTLTIFLEMLVPAEVNVTLPETNLGQD